METLEKPLGLMATLQDLTDPAKAPDKISLSYIVGQLDDQARGILIILFAIPNCVPGIPGTSAITGLPLLILTAQMALSRPAWLPGFLSRRTVDRVWLETVLAKAAPSIRRVERLIRPRLSILTLGPAEQLIGILCAILALTVMLPIPLGNTLPAVALIFFSLGMIGRDGIWVLAGLFVSGMAAAVLAFAGWAAFQSLWFLWMKWFGLS